MQFVQCLWLEAFVEKSLSHLKQTPKTVAMETKVCHVIKLWKSFQENIKGLYHRYRYMNGWYGNVYDKAPTLSMSIQMREQKTCVWTVASSVVPLTRSLVTLPL